MNAQSSGSTVVVVLVVPAAVIFWPLIAGDEYLFRVWMFILGMLFLTMRRYHSCRSVSCGTGCARQSNFPFTAPADTPSCDPRRIVQRVCDWLHGYRDAALTQAMDDL
jgi:hypothetical protein